jgi:YVTN family beta-propeller protein
MKSLSLAVTACALLAATLAIRADGAPGSDAPAPAKLTGGTGTIYLGSHAGRVTVIDEATEKVTADIPLKTGMPWAVHLSRDATRFYVQSADQEHFEVIDVASRQTLDTFTLSEGNKHIRALAFDVDPQNRFLVLVARETRKLIDRFEIGAPAFFQYDLKENTVVKTVAWSADPEPAYYYLNLKFSPDGKYLYVFGNEILILDATSLQKVDSWDLALPNEPGLGRFDMASMDETNDEPGFFTALFTMDDPVQKRPLLVVGRVNLGEKSIDFFPIGPNQDRGNVSFALGADRKHGYILIQAQEIRRYELWTIDIPGKRLQNKVEFDARPRMAVRSSSNGQILYIHQAGNTIDLYEAAGFKYLRTITLDADMMYNTFHVVPPRGALRPPPAPQPRP